MKSKRQTIWLVSMLSLMVILSAYYLFTEDSATKIPKAAEGQQISSEQTKAQTGTEDGYVVNEVQTGDSTEAASGNGDNNTPATEGPATTSEDQAGKETPEKAAGEQSGAESSDKSKDPAQVDKESTANPKTDEDVLKQVEAQGTAGSDKITNFLAERYENNAKKEAELLDKINDMNKSADETSAAQQELNALNDHEAKITDLEEQLQQQLKTTAVVDEKDNSYKVIVVSDKLEVNKAVSIVDLVMKQLGVTQDKVKVQYVTE